MIVNFEGQQHQFPDDASDAEISKALSALPKREDVTAGMALRGVPVLGAYVPQAEAAIRAATGQGEGATFGERYQNILPQRQQLYEQAERESPVTSEGLKLGGGLAATGPLGATAMGAKALGITGPLAQRAIMGAASGGGISAADALARGATSDQAKEAALWGAGLGAASGGFLGSRMKTNPVREQNIATLRAAGIEPTAGDIRGTGPVRWAEQHWGEMAGVNPTERTSEALSKYAMRNAGAAGERVTPQAVDAHLERLGNEFDRLAASHNLPGGDRQLGSDLKSIMDQYELAADVKPAVRHYVDQILERPATRTAAELPLYREPRTEAELAAVAGRTTAAAPPTAPLSGEQYQSLASAIGRTARGSSDPELKRALYSIKGALDDAMERQLARAKSPDLGAWQAVRHNWRNALVLENLATAPGTREGLITPQGLYQANKAIMGNRNVARGRGDYSAVAQAASDMLRPLPSSGTAQRTAMFNLPLAVAGGVGGYANDQDPMHGLYGMAAGFAPFAAGRAIMSRPAQTVLRNPGVAGASFRGATTPALIDLLNAQQ